jgi:hypothetical protein
MTWLNLNRLAFIYYLEFRRTCVLSFFFWKIFLKEVSEKPLDLVADGSSYCC